MHNEYRYGHSPRIRRGVISMLLAGIALLGSMAAIVESTINLITTAATGLTGPVFLDIPLQRNDTDAIISRWSGSVTIEPESLSLLGATVSGLDDRTMSLLMTVQTVGNVVSLFIGIVVAIPAAVHLFGRLRWHTLGHAVTIGGAVWALGALVHNFFYGFTIVLARAQISPDGPVTETAPFLGWDFSAVFVGGLFVVLGIAFNRVARFAHETDGMV